VNQSRLRVGGMLTQSARGPIITSEDGTVWVIEHEDEIEALIGKAVAAEGTVIGLDRLQTDWIGLATETTNSS
jgi:hypothetical protein